MVSVIIPTYNRRNTIIRAVKSVLNQTYTDLELIIVDDCSSDGTDEVIKTIKDKRIKYIYLECNSGACVARNRGIEAARGEYIAFQDSDDEWLPEMLEKGMESLFDSKADISFCGLYKVDEKGKKTKYPATMEAHICTRKELVMDSLVSTQTMVGKAEVYKTLLFDPNMPRMQDYDFIIRASNEYKIYFNGNYMVNVYAQDDSITAGKKQYTKRKEVTQMLMDKYKDLPEEFPEWKVSMLKIMAHCKVMLKEDATVVLNQIVELDPSHGNKLKRLLYKMHLLRPVLYGIDTVKR